MNASEKNVRDFVDVRDFIGRALKNVRMELGESKKDVSTLLRLVYGLREATEQWITNVEDGKFHLFFEEFEILCQALGSSVRAILDRTWELKKESALKIKGDSS